MDRAGEGKAFLGVGQAGSAEAPSIPAASSFWNQPVPRSCAPEPWLNDLLPWEFALPPGWGLSSHTPAQPTGCHLEMV